MKNILYILVAAALISITPFLVLFDKNCFPTHGIISYGIFIILLIFANIKGKTKNKKQYIILLASTYILCVAISWIDLIRILDLLNKSIGIYSLIPFLPPALALLLLKNCTPVTGKQINLFAFSIFFLHLIFFYSILNQPLLDFTLLRKIEFASPQKDLDRTTLQNHLLKRFKIINDNSISRDYIDTNKSNVIILVESWGIPLDSSKLFAEIDIFKDLNTTKGIHKRTFSHTKKAEQEDLIWKVTPDSLDNNDTITIPQHLATLGYTTLALSQDLATSDSITILKVDSLLNSCENKCFISFITADTKFPIQGTTKEISETYYNKLYKSLAHIATLVKKHPEVNFIIQGDHEPILSPLEFQNQFYKRWVPFIIFTP